jgi:nitroimidazol reductase NimA-like FMN-containing flavoprotein (pyridoxamine 5'-phosphate oxidase superfamily)
MNEATGTYPITNKTKAVRLPKRVTYDKAQVHAILDEGYICHVSFVADGQPYSTPTGYVRDGEQLYFHGSAAGRMLRHLGQEFPVCVTVTLVDGFVVARSVFHHSMNYRSVMILGKARLVTEREEKLRALRAFTNHIVPGRWEEARHPNEQELKATAVLAVPLEEVSAKVRTGPPVDEEEDYALPIWGGVVPVFSRAGEPIPDERVLPEAPSFDGKRLTRFRSQAEVEVK